MASRLSPEAWLARAEAGQKPGPAPIGAGELLFGAVAQATGADPQRGLQLAGLARHLDEADDAWGHRIRGAGSRLRGRFTVAGTQFEAAFRASGDAVFGLGAIDSYARAGQPDRARAIAETLIHELRDRPELAGRAWVNLANVELWQDRAPQARRAYDRALRLLAADDPVRAYALLGRSTARLYGGELARARQDAQAAQVLFQVAGADFHAALARLNLAQADLMAGLAEDAWDALRALESTLAEHPVEGARWHEYIGDALAHLGLQEEALAHYETALASPALPPLNRANVLFARGRLSGDPTQLRQAARASRRAGNEVWSLAAQIDVMPPRVLPAIIRRLRELGATYWADAAQLRLAETDPSWVKESDYPDLAWRMKLVQARETRSLPLLRQVFRGWLRQRLTVRSTAVAWRFFEEREPGVRLLIETLLENPTPARISEVVDVIRQTRTVTLIDELASARTLEPELEAQLRALRAELTEEPGETGLRLAGAGLRPGRMLGLTERTLRQPLPNAKPPEAIFWKGDQWVRIDPAGPTIQTLNFDFHKAAKWLEFELVPGGDVADIVRSLRAALGPLPQTVAPDAELWRLPWSLLADHEVVLCLGPALSAAPAPLPADPRVLVWAGYAPDLPQVEAEVEAVVRAFPKATVLHRYDEIRESLAGEFDLLHVAGHARFQRTQGMLSRLEFEGGSLFATEIARSPLRVQTAILSACETGALSLMARFEPDGLVRALLARGARTALATLWPLHDEAGATMMEATYQELGKGAPLDKALFHARSVGKQLWEHPYYWGAPVLFGGYAN